MLKALVPIDGSEFSESVFDNIKKLLNPQVYSLVLLEVAPIPEELEMALQGAPATWADRVSYTTASADLRRVLEQDRSAYVNRVWKDHEKEILASMEKARLSLERAGYEVNALVRFGDPAPEISDTVRQEAVDLVVMATHGRSGISRLVMGSVAEKVLRTLTIPVMMVRPVGQLAEETLPIAEIIDAMA
jgi:nucleotide-binding universal stress UspA family protein